MGVISIVKSVPATVMAKAAPIGAKVSAKAPELLLAGGCVSVGAGTVLACKATLDAVKKLEEGMAEAEALAESGADEGEVKKQHLKTGADVAVGYALPATLIVGGVVMIGMSHGIMNKRLVQALAAADAYQLALEDYRKRVAARYGTEAELELYNGGETSKQEMYVEKEDGTLKKQKVDVKVRDDGEFADPYMVRFGRDTSDEWAPEQWRNIDFIQTVNTLMNRRLAVQGRLFLREVYQELGLPYRPIGAVAGWALGNGDDHIIIDWDESYSQEELEDARAEMRKPVPDLWLKFNCDGNIVNVTD